MGEGAEREKLLLAAAFEDGRALETAAAVAATAVKKKETRAFERQSLAKFPSKRSLQGQKSFSIDKAEKAEGNEVNVREKGEVILFPSFKDNFKSLKSFSMSLMERECFTFIRLKKSTKKFQTV